MKGTRAEQTLAMPLTPKTITSITKIAKTIATNFALISKVSPRSNDMEFACTVLPIPKAAMAVKIAKITPSHFMLRPLSRAYIGPPSIVPLLVLTRYLTAKSPSEYLVAIPNTPVIQIQNTAPGPPRETAVATPTIFPVPIVAAREVISAPN